LSVTPPPRPIGRIVDDAKLLFASPLPNLFAPPPVSRVKSCNFAGDVSLYAAVSSVAGESVPDV
jgi:hypothetical protein